VYYFFEPLMEDGKRVVRQAEFNEFVDDIDCGCPTHQSDLFYNAKKYPILTMKKFEQDPFRAIRWVYGVYKEDKNQALHDVPATFAKVLWQAIEATMKELEGGK
jgi:hypothetical protein